MFSRAGSQITNSQYNKTKRITVTLKALAIHDMYCSPKLLSIVNPMCSYIKFNKETNKHFHFRRCQPVLNGV